MTLDATVEDARAVASAAAALARSLDEGRRVERAAEHLELQAVRILGTHRQGFDTGDEPTDDDERMGEALAQLDIGLTLISAEAALASSDASRGLAQAVDSLEKDADALVRAAAPGAVVHGFDTRRDGVLIDVPTAAGLALDDMCTAAADTASVVLEKAVGPVLTKVPHQLQDTIEEWVKAVSGGLLRWGLKAVRKGLDLLLSVVDLSRVERARDRIDQLLADLGQGRDARTVIEAVLGVDGVRSALADVTVGDPRAEAVVEELASLSNRYTKLCTVLSRIALAITSIAAVLAFLQATLPHGAAVTVTGLAVVLGAVVVLGRDYTGATDLPGRVVGVRRLVMASP